MFSVEIASATVRPNQNDDESDEAPICHIGRYGRCRSIGTRNSGHQSRYYGFLGMVLEPPSLKRQEVEAVRRMTPEPFGVNLIPAATDSELLEQQLRMLHRTRWRGAKLAKPSSLLNDALETCAGLMFSLASRKLQ
jgi:hypothetical protein